ncbi:hypothetical protein Cgig2_001895 [Carnegiea gigantea]|uniref:Uncharacterized protein n=1 Tax=Carnegiea gigantea TaxID=171969 RepID=A0A9Q1GWA1_9CARY|nr:hypothetical protein Cgig2_001895 [Carnegiea gigantea]
MKVFVHSTRQQRCEGDKSADSQAHSSREIFLLSSLPDAQESVLSYKLLHHDIDTKHKSWEKLPFQGEDLLVVNHLFDALYASLFVYEKYCSSDMRVLVPQNKLFAYLKRRNIHGFLGLPLSGFLYDEVVPPSQELKISLGRSCTHLFIAYHILRERFDHKTTIGN